MTQYAKYMIASKLEQGPASWFVPEARPINPDEPFETFLEGRFVRTVYGPVPLNLALDWPVFASYDELAPCAAWMGGRIPTFEEARSIYAYADRLKKDLLKSKLANKVPAVNGSVPFSSILLIEKLTLSQPPRQQRRPGDPATLAPPLPRRRRGQAPVLRHREPPLHRPQLLQRRLP